MTGPTVVPERRPRRLGRGIVALGCAVLAIVAAGVVAIPLGGWDTVALVSARTPELAPGEEYRGQHYSVAIEEAWVGTTTPDEYDEPEDGMTFVFVRAVMRNEWREPDTDGDDAIRFAALQQLETAYDRIPRVRVRSDGSAADFPPGVTSELLLQWEVPIGSVEPGEPLRLQVIDGTPAEAQLFSGTAWRNEHVAVEVEVVPQPTSALEFPWLDS